MSSAKECLPWSSLAAKRTQSSIFCKKEGAFLVVFISGTTVFSAKRSCLPWSFFSRGLKQRRKPGSFLLQLLCGPHLPCKAKTASQSGPGKRVPCALLYLAWNAAVFVICTTLAATLVILFTFLGKIFHYNEVA